MLESLLDKVAGLQDSTQVFSCEYCKIFKNTYVEEHLPTGASNSTLTLTHYGQYTKYINQKHI